MREIHADLIKAHTAVAPLDDHGSAGRENGNQNDCVAHDSGWPDGRLFNGQSRRPET